jgi:hypothetical protein
MAWFNGAHEVGPPLRTPKTWRMAKTPALSDPILGLRLEDGGTGATVPCTRGGATTATEFGGRGENDCRGGKPAGGESLRAVTGTEDQGPNRAERDTGGKRGTRNRLGEHEEASTGAGERPLRTRRSSQP